MTASLRRSVRSARLLAGPGLLLCLLAPAWADSPETLPARPGDSFVVGRGEQSAGKGYSSPMVIPAAAFISDGSDADAFMFLFGAVSGYGGGYLTADAGAVACLYAPVYLPQGSTVAELRANVVDNSDNDISVDLRRLDNATGATETMGSAASSGQSPSIQVLYSPPIPYNVVSSGSSYYLTTCVYENISLYNVSVFYAD